MKLYLYGYLQQLRSSRRLERECQRNVELMWLLNRPAPDHKTIAEFRRREGAALHAVAAAFVRFCRGQGLIRGAWLAIDGSKFEAVASRKAMLSRERLLREQAALERRVAEYLEQLDAADASEGDTGIDAAAVHEALEVLRQQQAQATPELMRLRRRVVEHPFTALKYRIFEKPPFVLRGRWGAGTEMSQATPAWNLRRAMAALGASQLRERLARA